MQIHNDELYHYGVRGMKWGVRRYQNKDGTLTEKGQKRYERDRRENVGKKKSNKVDQVDSNRWIKEDLTRSKILANESSNMANKLKNITDKSIRDAPQNKLDLSNMSDKEMRDQINRAFLEKQYNDIFAPQKITKGREYASKILDVGGDVLAVTSSALAIALAIKELRG